MAQLPPDGDWLVQQIDGRVVVFHRYTEEEVVAYQADDPTATAQAQQVIATSDRLTPEQKSFAHFWCGYFHAYANPALSHG